MAFRSLLGRAKPIENRSRKYLEEALYENLFKDGSAELSIRQNLNKFLESKKRVYKWEVGHTIKKLRSRNRYYPAHKLSETMAVRRGMNKTVSDQAIHLDLVAKVQGITAAEDYFKNLPESSKNQLTYGALFNCYCKELMTEKAEALMEKMKELKISLTSMPYNSFMTLYTKIGQPEKIPAIIQEMKACDVMPDCFTYNVWMRALAAVNDISGVERVVDEMNQDGEEVGDWTTYSNLASIYVNAGLFEKAEMALKELEKRIDHKQPSAYQFLITLYGRTGNVLELHRIWGSLRSAFPKISNISYLNMIQALIKANDLPAAEKCFSDWESEGSVYDMRIPNALIQSSLNEGSLERAEELKNRACSRGAKPNAKTHELFLDYYIKKGEYDLAVHCLYKAISLGRGNGRDPTAIRKKWIPSPDIVNTLMKHFEDKKDVDGAETFIEKLKKVADVIEVGVFESLIRTYAAAGKTTPMMKRRLKMEKVEVSDHVKKLLDVVCIE